MYMRSIRPNELYHHGIKGMHWGIRRYQNTDGSYTSAGAKRYGIKERIKQRKAEKEKIRAQKAYAKDIAKRLNDQDRAMAYAKQTNANELHAQYNYAVEYKKAMEKGKTDKAKKLIEKNNVSIKRLNQSAMDYQAVLKETNKIIKELDSNKDFVYNVKYTERADTGFGKDSYSKKLDTSIGKLKIDNEYYQSTTGNQYKVKLATERRKKSKKYQKHYRRGHTPIRTNYYVY